ncbi:ABC transporter substrate-binding protein [Amycolatopsis sulphurea]|uniref:ABC transporter substrate-binding protein n=1 Tax=Amycolatopsis sulphurea TaxID=76022 RepID=UPI001B809E9E|nr:ABC transporter substrate-binding protein [Amycolatopsis sulphurea]
MFETLIDYDRSGATQPAPATGWDLADGGRTVAVHPRDDVKFYSGRTRTAQDVMFSLQRAAQPAAQSQARSIATLIADMSAPDPHIVVIRLKAAGGKMADLFAIASIVDGVAAKGLNDDSNVIGTGLFLWQSRQQGSQLTLLVRRIPSALLVLVVASMLAFVLPRLAPGDPAVTVAGPDATAADIATIRTDLGLDRPLLAQYFDWLGCSATPGKAGQTQAAAGENLSVERKTLCAPPHQRVFFGGVLLLEQDVDEGFPGPPFEHLMVGVEQALEREGVGCPVGREELGRGRRVPEGNDEASPPFVAGARGDDEGRSRRRRWPGRRWGGAGSARASRP